MAKYERIDAEFDWNVKKGYEDDLEVLTRAVRKYLESHPDKPIAEHTISVGRVELCKMLGQIIESGLWNDAKQLRETAVEINSMMIDNQKSTIKANLEKCCELKGKKEELERTIENLKKSLNAIEDLIKAHEGDITEPDPMLASAKRAYGFIYDKTHSEALASKAFNSYLLRGINEGVVEKVDAEEIIKEAKEKSKWRLIL